MNLRINPHYQEIIDRAATLAGKNRSAFMLEASYKAAEEILLDQRLFQLNKTQWLEFNKLLNAPPKVNKKLIKLLSAKAPWE